MTYEELIVFLDTHIGYSLTHGKEVSGAIDLAISGEFPDPLAAEILLALYRGNQCQSPTGGVDRTRSFEGLASLRLRSQADDADPQLFRSVLKLSQELDKAFDQESIRNRSSQ